MAKKRSKQQSTQQPKPIIIEPELKGSDYPDDGVLIEHFDDETVVTTIRFGVTTVERYDRRIAHEVPQRFVFPRLYVGTNAPIPLFETEAVGAQFDEISPPSPTAIDPKFHVWRRVTWEVVPYQHPRWNPKKGKEGGYDLIATTAFHVVAERELTPDEIAYWTGEAVPA